MAERFYTVDPINVDGEPFTLEGLQSVLDKINETWGGKTHKAATVSPALSLGNGATIIAVENGRVMLVRDDAARDIAKARAATEQEPDGRTRTFYAEATIARVLGANRAEEVARTNLEGVGLMGLFFNAAMFVQDTLGDVPDCMSLQACEAREASIRSQLSRAKTELRDVTVMHFPPNKVAQFFELGTRPNEYYHVMLCVRTAPPASLDEHFPELPRRA